MMKVAECMEDDSMHKKVVMLLVLQLTMKVSIRSVAHVASGLKRGQKRKWDTNSPKDKGTLTEKKPRDVAKVRCFKCDELGHFAKDYEKEPCTCLWAQV
ncbi:unnamed protein product [Sphagnum troendelagicum]